MKESEFQSWIIDVAELHGWRWWHVGMPMRPIGKGEFVPDARGKGIPDLILMREDPPQVIFAEVKNENGTVEPAQQEFLRLAHSIHERLRERVDEEVLGTRREPAPAVQAFLWRPAHRDLIEAVLSAR